MSKPTEEDYEQFEEQASAAQVALRRITDKWRKDGIRRSHVECPICKGKLQYLINETNDHPTVSCDTAGCLAIMV